jgi:hypothetical protein
MPLALNDPALLHSILYCSDKHETIVNGRKERPSAVTHLRQAIQIINTRLQDPLQEISDSTIGTVALLALTEVSALLVSSKIICRPNFRSWLAVITQIGVLI